MADYNPSGYTPAVLNAEADALEAAAAFVPMNEAIRMQHFAQMLRGAAGNSADYRRFALTAVRKSLCPPLPPPILDPPPPASA